MIYKYDCKVDKGDYLEIEKVNKYITFEVVNYHDSNEGLSCALASLSKDQTIDLISKLKNMLEEIK